MLIGTTLHAFAQYAMMSWSAPFYMRVHQMPLADVASWLALMNGLGGGIGIYLGGRLSDAAGSRNPAGRVWVSAAAMLLMVPAAPVKFLITSLTASSAFGFLATLLVFVHDGPNLGATQAVGHPAISAY